MALAYDLAADLPRGRTVACVPGHAEEHAPGVRHLHGHGIDDP